MISASKDFTTFSLRKRGFTTYRMVHGFTLIELLVVIAIIAVLSVMGIAVFSGVQKGARDSRRKADIDALAKAYEVQRTSSYIPLTEANFSSGARPKDPNTAKGEYFNWLPTDGSGFKVCASLEDNPAQACNTPATNCYCKVSTQGTINTSSSVNNTASTRFDLGLGGSSSSSCDTNGTLLSGLVGYWKMDEVGSPFVDSSGSNKSATWVGGVSPAAGKLNNAGSFDGSSGYAVNNSGGFLPSGDNPRTITFWFKPNPGMINTKIALGYGCNTEGFGCADGGRGNYVGAWATTNSIGLHLDTCEIGGPPVPGTPTDWHFYTAVFNGNQTVTFYIDGGNQQTVPPQLGCTINSKSGGGISIGAGVWGYYNGQIDDVRIYNRVLSGGSADSEITRLYNGCMP